MKRGVRGGIPTYKGGGERLEKVRDSKSKDDRINVRNMTVQVQVGCGFRFGSVGLVGIKPGVLGSAWLA
jgi:hypothetical protein